MKRAHAALDLRIGVVEQHVVRHLLDLRALQLASAVRKCQSIVNIGSVMRVEPAFRGGAPSPPRRARRPPPRCRTRTSSSRPCGSRSAETNSPSPSSTMASSCMRSARHAGSSAIASSSTSSSTRAAKRARGRSDSAIRLLRARGPCGCPSPARPGSAPLESRRRIAFRSCSFRLSSSILKKCVVPRRASPPPPPNEPRACGTRS